MYTLYTHICTLNNFFDDCFSASIYKIYNQDIQIKLILKLKIFKMRENINKEYVLKYTYIFI